MAEKHHFIGGVPLRIISKLSFIQQLYFFTQWSVKFGNSLL